MRSLISIITRRDIDRQWCKVSFCGQRRRSRLRGCAGLFGSSLGSHVRRYVFSRSSSNVDFGYARLSFDMTVLWIILAHVSNKIPVYRKLYACLEVNPAKNFAFPVKNATKDRKKHLGVLFVLLPITTPRPRHGNLSITKTCLFKYTENFYQQKM